MNILTRIGRILCGLTGHNLIKDCTLTRVCLTCVDCGHSTSGWEVEPVRRMTIRLRHTSAAKVSQ